MASDLEQELKLPAGIEKRVAFSCKRRGLCPSCGARRMADTAAHLVEHVLPVAPHRLPPAHRLPDTLSSLPAPPSRLTAPPSAKRPRSHRQGT